MWNLWSVESNFIKYNCSSCKKDFVIMLDEESEKKFKNTFEFCKTNNNFILLSRRRIYSYKYMYDWEKIYEKELLEKENIYSNLNL